MSYQGNQPKIGNFIKLDDISASFDGVETEFDLTSDAIAVEIPTTRQMLISLNGVLQNPDNSFYIGATTTRIKFDTAPFAGDTFWGLIFGSTYDTVTPSDGSISNIKLASNAVTEDKIVSSAVSESKIRSSAVSNSKIRDLAVTLQKIADNAVTFIKVAESAKTTNATDITNGEIGKLARAVDVKDYVSSISPSPTYYTSNSTWTKPAGLTKIVVHVYGAGGGGASRGVNGSDGGDTSFGTHVSATGGLGGLEGDEDWVGQPHGLGQNGDFNQRGSGADGGQGSVDYQGSGNNVVMGSGSNGGYAVKEILAGDLASTETITIGSGGPAGTGTIAGQSGSDGWMIVYEY